MGNADIYVRARIDKTTKKQALKALKTMGMTASDAIRLLMEHLAREGDLPIGLHTPNATTSAAIAELEAGGGRIFNSISELMTEKNVED